MNFMRIARGVYRGEESAASACIDRDDYGRWFWTVLYEGGATISGVQYSFSGAKKAAITAAARRPPHDPR
jgi:hypothetical protein